MRTVKSGVYACNVRSIFLVCYVFMLLRCMLFVLRVPKIELEKSKGLSIQHVVQLQSELESLAEELKGEVMIFELAQHVQVSNL